jgi:hypothetical protein
MSRPAGYGSTHPRTGSALRLLPETPGVAPAIDGSRLYSNLLVFTRLA